MTDNLPAKKVIMLGDMPVEVFDHPPVPVLHADIFTEVRVVGGNVHISLASVSQDYGNPLEARICARLCMSLETLANIQTSVQGALAQLQEAKKAAN